MTTPAPAPQSAPAALPASPPGERGWGKLILGMVAFTFLPVIPQFRALIPIDQTILLLVPALAACTLVGWWAGGRMILAAAWIALASFVATRQPALNDQFHNMARGWSLVVAGAFGLVCLLGARRSVFPRAMFALTISLTLALMMSALGPVSGKEISRAVSDELTRRNAESVGVMNEFIGRQPKEWSDLVARVPKLGEWPAAYEQQLRDLAGYGRSLFPSFLALESLVALALAWSVYHRLSRTRLGPPLAPLREFRFNDQLVWGLIVGLTIVFLPTLASVRSVGNNLLVFFGALYALRGLGVLSFFMAPGALAVTATVGFAMFLLPVLMPIAVLGFLFLAIAAFGLGLGDTWADWRSRPRTTTSS